MLVEPRVWKTRVKLTVRPCTVRAESAPIILPWRSLTVGGIETHGFPATHGDSGYEL